MTAVYVAAAFIGGALTWDTFLNWLHASIDEATTLPAPTADVRPVASARQRTWTA